MYAASYPYNMQEGDRSPEGWFYGSPVYHAPSIEEGHAISNTQWIVMHWERSLLGHHRAETSHPERKYPSWQEFAKRVRLERALERMGL